MKTLEEIKSNCEVFPYDDPRSTKEHWVWQGARHQSGGTPYIFAPNYTKDPTGQTMTPHAGTRAVYHLSTKKPIRRGLIVFRICDVEGCISPHCIKPMTRRQYGEFVAATGRQAGQVKWSLSNKRSWNKRGRKIQDDAVPIIKDSDEDPMELARRFNCSISAIRKIQTGSSERVRSRTHNPFAGL